MTGNPCTFENVLNKVVDATKYDGRRREAETEQHCQQQCLQFEEEYKECWVYTYRLETCILYVDNIFGSIQDASDWKNQNNWNLGRKVCFSTSKFPFDKYFCDLYLQMWNELKKLRACIY